MNIHNALVALALTASLTAQVGDQDGKPKTVRDPQLEQTAARYQQSQWPGGALRGGLALGALELPGLRGGAIDHAPQAPVVRRFADAAGNDVVAIELYVTDAVADAHESLLMWLAMVSRAQPVPTAASQGMAVGDIGFVGWSKAPRMAWIAFVRGNLAVRVVCLDPGRDPHPDLPAIAAAVDGAIQRVTPLPKGAAVPKPTVVRFAGERARCRVGERIPLLLETKGAGDGALVEFVVGGPGLGYVEPDAAGRHVLHTTGAGAIDLQVLVTGPLGTRTTAATHIDVTAER